MTTKNFPYKSVDAARQLLLAESHRLMAEAMTASASATGLESQAQSYCRPDEQSKWFAWKDNAMREWRMKSDAAELFSDMAEWLDQAALHAETIDKAIENDKESNL